MKLVIAIISLFATVAFGFQKFSILENELVIGDGSSVTIGPKGSNLKQRFNTTSGKVEITSDGVNWSDVGSSVLNQSGQMLTHNGSEEVIVSPGIEGQILTFTSGLPKWENPSLSTSLNSKGEIQSHNGTNNVAIPSCTEGQLLIRDDAEDSGWKCTSNVTTAFVDGINSTRLDMITANRTGTQNPVTIQGNTTDIPFGGIRNNQGSWDGSGLVAGKDGYYSFDGHVNLQSADPGYVKVYVDGIDQNQFVSQLNVSSSYKKFQGKIYLTAGQRLSFRLSLGNTLNDSTQSYLVILQSSDSEAIMENLNLNQEQYFNTETQIGLWGGEALFKRCFKVDSTKTGLNALATWTPGLKPKNIVKYTSVLWALQVFEINGNIAMIYYNDSTGEVTGYTEATYSIQAGTEICMEYTK